MESIPPEWMRPIFVPLPKTGDLQDCTNYRTFGLISHVTKVYVKILLERVKPRTEETLAEEQAGFRKGRSAIDQI